MRMNLALYLRTVEAILSFPFTTIMICTQAVYKHITMR